MTGTKTNSGNALNERWHVGAKEARYHKDGKWFMPVYSFPAAFFDPDGYVLFRTEEEYLTCEYFRIGERVNVPGGISRIPRYKRMVTRN